MVRFSRVAVSLLVACLFLPAFADADIYKYVDKDGCIHFTNTPTTANFNMYMREKGSRLSIQEIISRYARHFRLEEALVRAVIKVESDFNPNAVSRKGALGLMQLVPKTAKFLNVTDPLDPEQCVRGGSHYLRMMLDQFDGDLDLALAAYNAGPTAVKRYGGVPPFAETQGYLVKVKRYLHHYRTTKENIL